MTRICRFVQERLGSSRLLFGGGFELIRDLPTCILRYPAADDLHCHEFSSTFILSSVREDRKTAWGKRFDDSLTIQQAYGTSVYWLRLCETRKSIGKISSCVFYPPKTDTAHTKDPDCFTAAAYII